jgi:hypothetical protein
MEALILSLLWKCKKGTSFENHKKERKLQPPPTTCQVGADW